MVFAFFDEFNVIIWSVSVWGFLGSYVTIFSEAAIFLIAVLGYFLLMFNAI